MDSLIRFFIDRPLIVRLIMMVVLVTGIGSVLSVKREAYPDVQFDMVNVRTAYPGASAEDVELNVTIPLERELQTVGGIDKMESASYENLSIVLLRLDPDAKNKRKIIRDIEKAVEAVDDLPEDLDDDPSVEEISADILPILEVSVGGNISERELRQIAERFKNELKRVDGVAGIDKEGYRDREIWIEVDPDKLIRYRLSLSEIHDAIEKRNVRLGGGGLESYIHEQNVITLGEFENPMDVKDVIIRSNFEGLRLQLHQIADIQDSFEPTDLLVRTNGKPGISLIVKKKESADIIRTVENVKTKLIELKKTVPDSVDIQYVNDLSTEVRNRLRVTSSNALQGFALVVLILLPFLGFRVSLWTAVSIPLSIIALFIFMPFFDITLDAISLCGLIIVLGMLVDHAIVISESITVHHERGLSGEDAAHQGTVRVMLPVFTTVLTTMMAFMPMFAMGGITGKFIRPIPIVICITLVISLLDAYFILPNHLAESLKARKPAKTTHWFKKFEVIYARILNTCLNTRYLVLGGFVALLILTMAIAGKSMRFVMVPQEGVESFYAIIEAPKGSSLDKTKDLVALVENKIAELPETELDSFTTRIGHHDTDTFSMSQGENHNWALITIFLTPHTERERTASDIITALTESFTPIKNKFELLRLEELAQGPPVGKALSVRVIGDNDQKRNEVIKKLKNRLTNIEGVFGVDDDQKRGKDELQIDLDYTKMAQRGITVSDVARTIRMGFDGVIVTKVQTSEEKVDFRLRMNESFRSQPERIKELTVASSQGVPVNIGDLISWKSQPGKSAIRHFNAERAITVTADVKPEIITSQQLNALIAHEFLNISTEYPGIFLDFGGEAEESEKSMEDFKNAFSIAIFLIFCILVCQFNSFSQPFLVMITIPFGAIGITGAFMLHGMPMSFFGMVGFIGLAGVVVNDSIMMVEFINSLMNKVKSNPDFDLKNAIVEGATQRLRAVVLTTLTTVAGLFPTAYGIGGSDPLLVPLVLGMAWGLLFATTLTLLLLPCLYLINMDLGHLFGRFLKRSPA